MPEAPDVKLSIRLPADMHATLTEQANREERSLNGQIVYLLRQTITTGTEPETDLGPRCTGINVRMGKPCGRMLATQVTRPWVLICPKCHTRNERA